MRKFLCACILVLFMVACQTSNVLLVTPTSQVAKDNLNIIESTLIPTSIFTAVPTAILAPTQTPLPTESPTQTPSPVPTPTPLPHPFD